LTELEAEFEVLKGGKKAKPERLLKSQQQVVIGDDENDIGWWLLIHFMGIE